MPAICLHAVFKKANAAADEAKALQAVAQMPQGEVVEVAEALALRAAFFRPRRRLTMADRLILAIARDHEADLWTQDEHVAGLPGMRHVEGYP